jgi:uncharacterized protein YcfJ
MTRDQKKIMGIVFAGVLLASAAAAGAAYYARNAANTQISEAKAKPVTKRPVQHQQVAAAQPAKPSCDDGNVVGTVVGAVGGGLLGSQIGSGHGQTAAAIGGTVGGAYLGQQYIPTQNVTCAK